MTFSNTCFLTIVLVLFLCMQIVSKRSYVRGGGYDRGDIVKFYKLDGTEKTEEERKADDKIRIGWISKKEGDLYSIIYKQKGYDNSWTEQNVVNDTDIKEKIDHRTEYPFKNAWLSGYYNWNSSIISDTGATYSRDQNRKVYNWLFNVNDPLTDVASINNILFTMEKINRLKEAQQSTDPTKIDPNILKMMIALTDATYTLDNDERRVYPYENTVFKRFHVPKIDSFHQNWEMDLEGLLNCAERKVSINTYNKGQRSPLTQINASNYGIAQDRIIPNIFYGGFRYVYGEGLKPNGYYLIIVDQSNEKLTIFFGVRGTNGPSPADWLTNIDVIHPHTLTVLDKETRYRIIPDDSVPTVGRGFFNYAQTLSNGLSELSTIINTTFKDYTIKDITILGHSLGAATASIFAEFVTLHFKEIPKFSEKEEPNIHMFLLSSPGVVNEAASAMIIETVKPRTLFSVYNSPDIVIHGPNKQKTDDPKVDQSNITEGLATVSKDVLIRVSQLFNREHKSDMYPLITLETWKKDNIIEALGLTSRYIFNLREYTDQIYPGLNLISYHSFFGLPDGIGMTMGSQVYEKSPIAHGMPGQPPRPQAYNAPPSLTPGK